MPTPLPSSLGRPALRALNAAGIRSLEQAARVPTSKLAALHGVGPKALSTLRALLQTAPPPKVSEERPIRAFASAAAFERWLSKEHASGQGLWLKLAKKGSGIASVTYEEAVELALCYGWIDGLRKTLDAEYFLQRFTPRRPRSVWSKLNRQKAKALIAAGRMKPAGLREVEAARADGRWAAAHDPPSTASVPEDLRAALAHRAGAEQAFGALDAANRYSFLYRLHHARRPETRARVIAQTVDRVVRGDLPHPDRGRTPPTRVRPAPRRRPGGTASGRRQSGRPHPRRG